MAPAKESLASGESPVVYEAMAATRRRQIIHLLLEADAPLTLTDLAREIIRREREEIAEEVAEERIEHVLTSLYHHHVPKLADCGLVEYDRPERRVAIPASGPLTTMGVFDR